MKRVRVGLILCGIHGEGLRTTDGFTVCDGSCRRAVAVNAIGAGAEHHNVLPSDLLCAVQHKRLIAPAHPVSGYGTTQFAAANNRHRLSRMFLAKFSQLVE